MLALLGRWDEVFIHAEKAIELSPLDPTWPFFACWLHIVVNDFYKAEALIRQSLELVPGFPLAVYAMGHLYTVQGRIDDAIEIQEQLPVGNPIRNWSLGPTYAIAGRVEDALAIAAEMSVDPGPKDMLHLAFIYSGLGDYDEAMRWFELCFETRVDWLPWIAVEQTYGGTLKDIRKDSRFKSLIKKLNLK